MNRFDLQSHLDDIYAHFPEADQKPVIGITGNYEDLTCKLGQGYYKSVVAAGGVPVVIPPVADKDVIINTLEHLDGLILSGGGDINPLWAGEEPSPKLHGVNQERDLPELLIAQLAYNRQIPMLGICRGIQTLAVALGGKVAQDIGDVAKVKHSQDADRSEPTHSISIIRDSILDSIYKSYDRPLMVNSFHHQAVVETGDKFRVVAQSADNIIEAIESTEYKSIVGVQWHPECLEEGLPLFQWLVGEAASFRQAQRVHNRVLTLDTHCDTPMFFPQNVDFGTRDPKLLVDLHKMTEGHQDATIMVAYLPQAMPLSDKPKVYTDMVFDKIEAIVAKHNQYTFCNPPGSAEGG